MKNRRIFPAARNALIMHEHRKKSHPSHTKNFRLFLFQGILLAAIVLFMAACGRQRARVEPPQPPPPASSETARTEGEPGSTEIPGTEGTKVPSAEAAAETDMGPSVRVGLTTDALEVRISAPGDFYFQGKNSDASPKPVRGEIRVRIERGGDTETPGTCYRIQVLSLRNRDSAEKLREQLENTYHVPVILSENSDATSNRVRIGEFTTREQAQELLTQLKNSGYPDAFVIEDTRLIRNGKPVLTFRGPGGQNNRNNSGFIFLPLSKTDFLSVNGKAYRGSLEVRLNGGNRITVINNLHLEEYLLGVVPAEMSPYQYPEFDALAAQSIAARTYTLKHLGQYSAQGFDLTNDDRTQVYGGVASEREATNDAVRGTAGLAIYYDDTLIDAMYMSTCGGRTEDASEVFDSTPVPYLTSVICASESSVEDQATIITAHHSLETPIYADDGSIANRDLELALVMGMIDDETPVTEEYLAGILSREESLRLFRAVQNIVRGSTVNPESYISDEPMDTRIRFLKSAAEFLFGPDEIRRSTSAVDATYYVDNLEDGDTVPENARRALAFLMQKSLWRPFPDNTIRPNEPVTRREGLLQLLRWTEFIHPEILLQGVFAGNDPAEYGNDTSSEFRVKWNNSTRKFRLSENLFLFRREAGRKVPVNSLKIIGNEKTYFHLRSDEAIDFLEVELNPTGASSDRYSPVATWEATFTRSEMQSKLRDIMGAIGEFNDLEPVRIGKSGRVVQIRIVGTRSSVVVNGYRFRGALGLRDTLYTITRRKNPNGSIATFTFNGRGWGHGVGLCQVGAYGMAKAGKTYEEILKTYYQGVEIHKAY